MQVSVKLGPDHKRVWRRGDGLAKAQVRPLAFLIYCLPTALLPLALVSSALPGRWPPLSAVQQILEQVLPAAVEAGRSRGCPAAQARLRVQGKLCQRIPGGRGLAVWQPEE